MLAVMAPPKNRTTIIANAKRTTPKKHRSVNMKKSDPKYYATVGSLGGKKTLKKLGKEHFRNAARLSHQARAAKRRLQAEQSSPAE